MCCCHYKCPSATSATAVSWAGVSFSGIGCTSLFKQGRVSGIQSVGHSACIHHDDVRPTSGCFVGSSSTTTRRRPRTTVDQTAVHPHSPPEIYNNPRSQLTTELTMWTGAAGRLVPSSPSEILSRPICSSSSFTTGHFDWIAASDLSLGHMIIIIYDYHQTKTTTAL